MAEEVKTPEAEVEVKVEEKKEPDLITRVSQFKKPEEAKQELDSKFNINDLDSTIEQLPDPKLKEQVLGLKKSLLKGENQKYQEIANLRKQYETALAEQTNWTPERIQTVMKDPNFVQAAQAVLGQQQTDESSMLTEKERKLVEESNRKVNQLLEQQQRQLAQVEHNSLKSKYANYDPDLVENLIKDLSVGKAQITREHIWRAYNYEQDLKRAYDLGAQDKVILNEERVKGMTIDSNLNMNQPSTIERQPKESTQQFILRSYQQHSKKK